MTVALDASFTIPRFVHDEDSRAVDALLHRMDADGIFLVTAPHWRLECWSGLHMAWKRGRLSREDRDAALHRIDQFPIIRLPDHAPVESITHLAELHGLSVYDAAYLALALDEGALLATGDDRLGAAAESYGIRWTPKQAKLR